MWALIILILLTTMDLGCYLAKHGEQKTGKYNFFLRLIDYCLTWFLLYKAGLFDRYL